MATNRTAELQVGLAKVSETQAGGALPVASVGISGSVSGVVLTAPVDQPDDATGEIWNSATGVKAINVRSITGPATAEATIIGWSATSGDTTVETNLAAAIAKHASPDGTEYPNQTFLTLTEQEVNIYWDGVTTIKRLAAISTAAGTAHLIAVTLVA